MTETGKSAMPLSEATKRHRHGEIVDRETRRDLDSRSFEIADDRVAQHARNLGDADEGLAHKIARIESLLRRKPMVSRQDGDERLLQNQLKRKVRVRFVTQEGNVDPPLLEVLGERYRKAARHSDLDIGQFVAEDARGGREPSRLLAGKEAYGENRLGGPGGAAGRLRGGFGLHQRQTGVIEEGAAGRRQSDATHAAGEERNADFILEVAHLAAERGLRRVQARFRRELHASRFRDGDEIAKVPQLHSRSNIPFRYITSTYKVIFGAGRRRYSCPRMVSGRR